MKLDERIYGFHVKAVRPLEEINAVLYEMVYEKTKTELCWICREDDNMAFGIAFKTIPEDSTGVFHILEHSVLSGSEKYPIKDPFVELLKSSVNTFLNAMTYPDKTVYPFSSRNHKDFMNLLDIYMDAVLHPRIYQVPEIFRQEGWRYETNAEGELEFQGVVLNEMKGAYASSEAVMENAMNRVMFPDSPYAHESGGHPVNIPDLTYEQFIAMHRKYYHPSNARIMLCGSVKIEEVLKRLDDILKDYDYLDADFSIPYQKTIQYQCLSVPYEIGEDEDKEEKAMISTGYLMGTYEDQEKTYAAAVLADYLAGDNEAPLKKAILSEGLANDMSITVHDGIQETWVSWDILYTEEDRAQRISNLIDEKLKEMAENGLDHKRLLACFNHFAFGLRDKDSLPRSLFDAITMLDSWLYGGDPARYLLCEEVLSSLEKKMEERYFEELIRELFIDNTNKSTVILVPSETLGEEKEEEERNRLLSKTAEWTEKEFEEQKELEEKLVTWQTTPDTEEALSSIPVLTIEDIKTEPKDITPEALEVKGVTVLRHKNGSNLVSLNLRFESCDLSEEELPLMSLMTEFLGKLKTKDHTSDELQLLLKTHIGAMNVTGEVFTTKQNEEKIYVRSSAVVLKKEQKRAAELITEILTRTDFTDLTDARNIIHQLLTELEMGFAGSGHQYGILRAGATLNAVGAANEMISGGTFIRNLKEISRMDDAVLRSVLKRISDLTKKLFVTSRLTLSVSEASDEDLPEYVIGLLPKGEKTQKRSIDYKPFDSFTAGIPIPAQIGYAVKGSHDDERFTGAVYVLQNLLNYSYLWNEIRVLNGAYGCGFLPRDNGDLFFYSFRDPKPENSLRVYDQAAGFIREFLNGNEDLTKAVIGAMGTADPLLSPRSQVSLGDIRYLKGVTFEDTRKLREQLLNCSKQDLLDLLPRIQKCAEENHTAVVAGKTLLDDCTLEGLVIENVL